MSDISEKAGLATVEEIKELGGDAIFVHSDTSKPETLEALVNQTVSQYGALNIAANIAGISGVQVPLADYPLDVWDKVISTNLSGIFYGMKYQIPAILKSGGGTIVNMSSVNGQIAAANSAAYTTSKHGIVGLTKAAALDYAQQNIRINAVGPGVIETPLIKDMPAAQKEAILKMHPIGRLVKAEEVAELVLWLSSEKSSFVTGSYYPIDGGYLAQ